MCISVFQKKKKPGEDSCIPKSKGRGKTDERTSLDLLFPQLNLDGFGALDFTRICLLLLVVVFGLSLERGLRIILLLDFGDHLPGLLNHGFGGLRAGGLASKSVRKLDFDVCGLDLDIAVLLDLLVDLDLDVAGALLGRAVAGGDVAVYCRRAGESGLLSGDGSCCFGLFNLLRDRLGLLQGAHFAEAGLSRTGFAGCDDRALLAGGHGAGRSSAGGGRRLRSFTGTAGAEVRGRRSDVALLGFLGDSDWLVVDERLDPGPDAVPRICQQDGQWERQAASEEMADSSAMVKAVMGVSTCSRV